MKRCFDTSSGTISDPADVDGLVKIQGALCFLERLFPSGLVAGLRRSGALDGVTGRIGLGSQDAASQECCSGVAMERFRIQFMQQDQ